VPQYLLAFAPRRSFELNVQATLLDEFSPLFREPEFLLREELRDVAGYQAVLSALASGARFVKAIAKASHLPERSLHYYLETLVSLGYVARRFPLTGAPPAARHVGFSLEDSLLRFWFRFVFPHQGFVQRFGPERAYTELVAPGLEAYFGSCFERLCREALPLILAKEGVTAEVSVGEWWSPDAQIDVVGVRSDGWTELGECKWGAVRSWPSLERELETRVVAYPNPRIDTLSRRFFVRELPTSRKAPGRHGLSDLYLAAGVRHRR
jgi:AAA+ ATPase superfamily predicted ATPase